jgi:hypothetical protein
MNPATVGLAAVAVTIIIAIITATWILSQKIGDIRVELGAYHEQSKARDTKVDELWSWWTGTRHPSSETALAHRGGQ